MMTQSGTFVHVRAQSDLNHAKQIEVLPRRISCKNLLDLEKSKKIIGFYSSLIRHLK